MAPPQDRAFQASSQLWPICIATGMRQTCRERIAGKFNALPGRQLNPQKLQACIAELVRLVKNHHAHRRQQLCHPRLAHGHVGKKQVVVDHHQIGGHGLPAGLVHVAVLGIGAMAAQAVFAR